MSSSNAAHVANFVKDCLHDWYGRDCVITRTPSCDEFTHSFAVWGCFSINIKESGEIFLYTSRALGPDRVFSGMFLDILVDAAEKEFPDMQKRKDVGFESDDDDWSWGPEDCAQVDRS